MLNIPINGYIILLFNLIPNIKIMNNSKTNIYINDTNNGLRISYDSYEPWYIKTARIKAFYDSAHKWCSKINLFQKQIAHIKKVMSWNGYPRYVRNKITKLLENWKNTKNNNSLEQQEIARIFCRIPYAGAQGET